MSSIGPTLLDLFIVDTPQDPILSIEDALEQATAQGSLSAVTAVIKDPRFATITKRALGKALGIGCQNGNSDIVEAIFKSSRFAKINISDRLHDHLTNIAHSMGYKYITRKGACRGFAMMGVQAIVGKDVHSFNDRLAKLIGLLCEHDENIPNVIDILQRKENHQLLIDFTAFFDGAQVWHDPSNCPQLFKKELTPLCQLDSRAASLMASLLHPVDHANQLCQIANWAFVCNPQELSMHLEELRTIFAKEFKTTPTALILNTSRHAIAIAYCPIENTWFFIDANHFPISKINHEGLLALDIFQAFTNERDIERMVLSAQIFTPASHKNFFPQTLNMQSNGIKLRDLFTVTPEKAQFISFDGSTLLDWAIKNFDVPLMNNLIQSGAHTTQPSLLNSAVLLRFTEGMRLLLDAGANPNSKDSGETPIAAAIKSQNLEAICMLLDARADLNLLSCGTPPIAQALDAYDLPLAQFLIKHGADINARCASQETLLGRAIHKSNLNAINIEQTPQEAKIAADQHLRTITFLLDKGADPNVLSQGKPPISLAVDAQNVPLAELLINRGANINIPLTSKETLLERSLHNQDTFQDEFLLAPGAYAEEIWV